MTNSVKFPFYAKLSFTFISLIAIVIIIIYGQGIIVPLLMAGLFAILLGPITNFLKSKLRFPHVLAVFFTVLLFISLFIAVIFFLSWQISDMMNDLEKIKANLNVHISNLQDYFWNTFALTKREQDEMIGSAASSSGKELVGSTLISFSDTMMNFILVPIYTFLILLYKNHFIKFLGQLFLPQHHAKVQEILSQVKVSVQGYIVGLFIELVIVSVLTSVGFMIIGVEYAILLGVITGILNLIPYVGILVAGLLSIVASLTGSTDLSIVLGVIVVNIVVQFVDNNLLVPMIVSSKVKINALVSIVGIIIAGAIAGVAGMFLAIPLIAIMKVIFDRVDELKPWGYLMGDDIPKTFAWRGFRLPQYSNEDSSGSVVSNTEMPGITYTETATGDIDQKSTPE